MKTEEIFIRSHQKEEFLMMDLNKLVSDRSVHYTVEIKSANTVAVYNPENNSFYHTLTAILILE